MIPRFILLSLLVLGLVGCGVAHEPAAQDPILELLTQNGWKPSGARKASAVRLPADFRLKSGSFPWRIVVDLSLDIGLDPQPLAGQEVGLVSLPVEDVQGGRLDELKRLVDFRAYILLDQQTGRPVGAYLLQTGKNGEAMVGAPGPSLSGRGLDEITGLNWPEYMQKYRAEAPPAEVLEAERPRNAIYQYFRAAARHDCDELWALMAYEAKAGTTKDQWCTGYDSLASLRVIEIEGYAKDSTPQGFRFLGSNELAEQYYVILDVRGGPGTNSDWREGRNNLLIPMVHEQDGQWRLGHPTIAPAY